MNNASAFHMNLQDPKSTGQSLCVFAVVHDDHILSCESTTSNSRLDRTYESCSKQFSLAV